MTARWARPSPDLHQSKLDAAISAGFDPGEDYGSQPVDPSNITPAMARYNHQGAEVGCENCGERCDDCGDRMCDRWGPERRACGTTCIECPCDCQACLDQREDMRADLLHRIQGEGA